ncbi:MAG: autotransporter domain-containing protein [Endomicrobium sp.]|nr:autotransporter domain-containing protein [Endomicrobium sp.]
MNFTSSVIEHSGTAIGLGGSHYHVTMGLISNDAGEINYNNSVLSIANSTISATTDGTWIMASAAGIYNIYANMTIAQSSVSFYNNYLQAQQHAATTFAVSGSIFNILSTMTISGSTVTFDANTAISWIHNGAYGVASAASAINNQYSLMNITDSVLFFANNRAEGYGAGGANRSLGAVILNYSYLNSNGIIHELNLNSTPAIMNITNSVLTFTQNQQEATGGVNILHAIIANAYPDSIMNFTSSQVNFTSNTARALLNIQGGEITFTDSDINFIDNNLQMGLGGAIFNYIDYMFSTYGNKSNKIDFINSRVNFINNSAENGSAIANTQDSIINVSGSTMNFTGNCGDSVIYNNARSATINFTNSKLLFNANEGSQIHNQSAALNFTNSQAEFTDILTDSYAIDNATYDSFINIALSTISAANVYGFIHNVGTITVSSSVISSVNNSMALRNIGTAEINFTLSAAMFQGNNSAENGGAIYNEANAKINFSQTSAIFSNNTSAGLGGAIYNAGVLTFDTTGKTITFINNTAGGQANDIHNANGIINITGSSGEISINSAISGTGTINKTGSHLLLNVDGAQYTGIFNQSGGTTTLASGFFGGTNNITGGTLRLVDGGIISNSAIFGGDAVLEIAKNEGMDFNYEDVTWSDYGTIYKSGAGILTLLGSNEGFSGTFTQSGGLTVANDKFFSGTNNITGGTLRFEDGASITSEIFLSTDAVLNINNASEFTIAASNISGSGKIIKTNTGVLNISAGSGFNGTLEISKGVTAVKNDAALNFSQLIVGQEGKYSAVNDHAGQTTTVGSAQIGGELAIDVDLSSQKADVIKAETGFAGGSSGKIEIGSQSSRLNLNIFGMPEREVRIALIRGEGGINGRFESSSLEALGLTKRGANVRNFLLEYLDDGIDLIAIISTDYSSIERLTHNQSEIAAVIDAVTNGETGFILKEFEDMVYDEIELLDDQTKKKAFDELHGSIIANALALGAINYGGDDIFDRLYPAANKNETERNIWGQGYAYGNTYGQDDNSIGEFKVSGQGLKAGADLFTGTNYTAGIYAGFAHNDLRQGDNKGSMQEKGIGIYGGIFGDKLDIKGQIYAGTLDYDIKRNMSLLNRNTQTQFGAYNIKIDAKAQYIAFANDILDLAPFVGLKGGFISNEEIKESGGNGAALTVYADNYIRADGLLGAAVSGAQEKINWHAKIYAQYIITGEKGYYNGEFSGLQKEINIWGVDKDRIVFSAAIGAGYIITDNLDAYANLYANFASKTIGYYASAGINYRFLKIKEKTKVKAVVKEEKAEIKKEKKIVENVIDEMIGEKDILDVWEADADEYENVNMQDEITSALGLETNEKVYTFDYDGRVFFFRNAKEAGNFIKEINAYGGSAVFSDIKESMLDDNNDVSFEEYADILGDIRDGVLIKAYVRGINEAEALSEEAKRVKRNAVMRKVLQEAQATMVWELEEDSGEIKLDENMLSKLGIKKGNAIYFIPYGNKIFVFKDMQGAQKFVKELNEAGAKSIDEKNIREVKGVEIREDRVVKAEEIKELGDTSKGIIARQYSQDITEMNSVAEEEKIKDRESANQEKIEAAQERRMQPTIKSYRLNVANFETNGYELTQAAKEIIKKRAKEIRQRGYTMITVEGHTDSVGNNEVNDRISRFRGESVYKEFLLNAIPADKISFTGFGSKMPIAPNDTEKGRAANRRTEIFVE